MTFHTSNEPADMRSPKTERRFGLSANLVLLCCGLLASISCRQAPLPVAERGISADVLARIGDSVIDSKMFEAELARRSRATPARYATAEQREELLEEMIRDAVLFERAKAAGYDRKEELVRSFERMVIAKYEEENRPTLPVTPSIKEIEKYYQQRQKEFATPEKVRVALIQLKGSTNSTPEKQVELRERASKLREEAMTASANELTFGDLARKHSEDLPTRYKGGDCGWSERGGRLHPWPQAVSEGMFALKSLGEISPVIQANGNCYLLKLVEHQPAGVRPFSEVKDFIAHRLAQQKKAETETKFYEQQKTMVRVDVNKSALAQIRPPEAVLAKTPTAPPKLPAR